MEQRESKETKAMNEVCLLLLLSMLVALQANCIYKGLLYIQQVSVICTIICNFLHYRRMKDQWEETKGVFLKFCKFSTVKSPEG